MEMDCDGDEIKKGDDPMGKVSAFLQSQNDDPNSQMNEDSMDGQGSLLDNGESVSAQNSDLDEADEAADVLGEMGLSKEQLKEIEKSKQDGMFVSAWEEDETGVDPKDLADPNEQFLTAAENGDVDGVRRLIEINPLFVNAADKDSYTALHRAAYNNHTAVVRLLLQKGANPEARTSEGWTVLHSACAWGNFEVVAILLSHGVDVNALSNGNLHALHLAVSSQEDAEKVLHTVRYLLQAPGVDAGISSGAGDTPSALARRSSARLYALLQSHFEKI